MSEITNHGYSELGFISQTGFGDSSDDLCGTFQIIDEYTVPRCSNLCDTEKQPTTKIISRSDLDARCLCDLSIVTFK